MRFLCIAALIPLLGAANAECQEPAKLKVAVVRIDRLMNNNMVGYEQLRILTADKETLDILKKTNGEIKALMKSILDAEDDNALNEMSRKMEFLNRKSQLLRQRFHQDSRRDMQQVVREFVVEHFQKDYQMIAQNNEVFDQLLYKGDVEIRDITDEAAEVIRKYANAALGE